MAYTVGGPGHEHWLKARDQLRASNCYDKFAAVFNKLALQDPIYLILALGIVEYTTAMGKCAAVSKSISNERRAERIAAEAAKVKP